VRGTYAVCVLNELRCSTDIMWLFQPLCSNALIVSHSKVSAECFAVVMHGLFWYISTYPSPVYMPFEPCIPLLACRVGPVQSLDGRPYAAGVVGPVRGTFLWSKKTSQCPRAVIGDIALCTVPSFWWDVKRVFWPSVVTKDPIALIVRVGVLTPVSWLNSQAGPHTVPCKSIHLPWRFSYFVVLQPVI
jgi:hypothetical protein